MKKDKIINYVLAVSFVFYAVFTVCIILFKYVSPPQLFSANRYFSRSINLIPFYDLFVGDYIKLDVWGNIILFAPLGVYLKIWTDKKIPQLAMIGVFVSISFELLQFIFAIGATDITDVIYNTAGTLLGTLIFVGLNRIFKSKEKAKTFVSAISSVALICVVIILILIY